MTGRTAWTLALALTASATAAAGPLPWPFSRGNPPPPAAPQAPAATEPGRPVAQLGQKPPAGEADVDPDPAENLRGFDADAVELRWEDRKWLLAAGGEVLKDFGTAEGDARLALQTVTALKLNARGTVGEPPVMEYWLADGKAPAAAGNRVIVPFDPASLRLQEVQGCWWVRDKGQALFNFGTRRDDARRALSILKKYAFNQIAVIGGANPTMVYFLSDPNSIPPGEGDPKLRAWPQASPRSALFGPDRSVMGERAVFDERKLEVRRDGDSWKLASGRQVLADFGPAESEARDALRAAQYHRLNEVCTVGSSGFRFYLSRGRAPTGVMIGLTAQRFRRDDLKVEPSAGRWLVMEGEKPLFDLGESAEDAHRLVKLIRHYGFDHVCRVGYGPESPFTFLTRSW